MNQALGGGRWRGRAVAVALAVLLSACGSNGGSDSTGSGGTGGTTSTGGSGAAAGVSGTSGSGAAAGATSDDGATNLSGTLGELGAVEPIVSSLVISNSGETLVYMSTVAIDCDTLSTSRWLGSIDASAQVVEIVVKSSFSTGTATVGGSPSAEVNYAKGGRSSSYEQNAASGTVTFTTNTPKGPVAGTVDAKYSNPAGNVKGTFSAEFCDGGQGY